VKAGVWTIKTDSLTVTANPLQPAPYSLVDKLVLQWLT